MKKLLFIVNPHARGGKNRAMADWLVQALKARGRDDQIVVTRGQGEIWPALKEAIGTGISGVVSVGGDGSASHLLRALHNLAAPLAMGMICNGSGNDIQRTLKLPKNREKALDLILSRPAQPLDYGLANGVPFLNSASVGFDAEVIVHANKVKSRLASRYAYIHGLIKALSYYEPLYAEVSWPEGKLAVPVYVFAIANGKYYGGGFSVAPMAEMADGLFHTALLHGAGPKGRLRLLGKVLRKSHIKGEPQSKIIPTDRLNFYCGEEFLLNLDGELSWKKGKVDFEMVRGGLDFLGLPE